MSKLKLIDILNMVSKGELKEGTQVKFDGEIYTYSDDDDSLVRDGNFSLLDDIYLRNINDECELIESTKIEKLDVRAENKEGNGFVFNLPEMIIADKLNEVIDHLNKEGK